MLFNSKSLLLSFWFCSLFFLGAFAQKPFEGKIVYSIEYIEVPEEVKGMENMLPSETKLFAKGQKVRMEQQTPLGGTNITIRDNETGSTVMLMDIMGQKMKFTLSDGAQTQEDIVFKEVPGEKEIAGYRTKKATAEIKDMEMQLVVFYTDQFTNPGMEYQNLKGLPLEYEVIDKGIKMRLTATKINETPIDETYFVVPDGYVEMSAGDLQKMLGQ